MLGNYLNQTVALCKKSGTDARGQPIYDAAVIIKCRYQSQLKNVMENDKQITKTQHVYYLESDVSEGHKLDNKIVSAMTNISGNIKAVV